MRIRLALFSVTVFLLPFVSKTEATLITFDNINDLSLFRYNGGEGNFSWMANSLFGGGLSPGQSNDSDNAVFKQGYSNAPGTLFSLSIFWKIDSALRDPLNGGVSIDIHPVTSVTSNSTSFGLRIWSTGAYFDGNPSYYITFAGHQSPSNGAPLIDGHWYKSILTIANIGGTFGQLDYSTSTLDYGLTGTDAPSEVTKWSLNRTINNISLSSADQFFWALKSAGFSGAVSLDNLEITAVPEPQILHLLLMIGAVWSAALWGQRYHRRLQ